MLKHEKWNQSSIKMGVRKLSTPPQLEFHPGTRDTIWCLRKFRKVEHLYDNKSPREHETIFITLQCCSIEPTEAKVNQERDCKLIKPTMEEKLKLFGSCGNQFVTWWRYWKISQFRHGNSSGFVWFYRMSKSTDINVEMPWVIDDRMFKWIIQWCLVQRNQI